MRLISPYLYSSEGTAYLEAVVELVVGLRDVEGVGLRVHDPDVRPRVAVRSPSLTQVQAVACGQRRLRKFGDEFGC